MKTYISVGFSGVVSFVIALLLLQVEYPWSTYAAFGFSKGMTLASYLLAAVMVASMGVIATSLCLRAFKGSLLMSSMMCFVAMFVSLSAIALLLGPAGFDVPGTRLNGIFFSDWKCFNFMFMVAAPASIVTAALCAWLVHKQSDV
jgi:Co/Zn/Cd efflux system component